MQRKNWIRLSSLAIIIGSFFVMSISEKLEAATFKPLAMQKERSVIQIQEPLIFVPGTGGTTSRFDGLIDTLSTQDKTTSFIKAQVNRDESVTITGTLSDKSRHPLIVIAFEDASDDALPLQGKWYQIALQAITRQYAFTRYTFLGHSNGGLILTQYLEDQYEPSDPKVLRAMTLGTPFNDMDARYNEHQTTLSAPKEYSTQLTNYLANQTRMPDIDVLNVIGDTGDATDGVVEMTSVLAGRLLYQDKGAYQEMIVTEDAQHSALVENEEVVSSIHSFLWLENK